MKYLHKRSLHRAYNMPRVQWVGRCPSATARSTVGGTKGCLDLECDPLMHIIEKCCKENPKLQQN